MSSDLCGGTEYCNEVSRYYLSMAPQNDLQKIVLSLNDGTSNFNEEKQDILLSCTVHHPLALKLPPSVPYSKHFLKWIMLEAEEAGNMISEKLYVAYTDLIQSKERENCYQHYILNSQLIVTIEASPYLVSSCTTGLKVWEAAKWLADWCIENAFLFKNKCIIELGSGLGLTGLVVCQICQVKSYTFSDNSPEVLRALHRNISLNGHQLPISKNHTNCLDQVQNNDNSRKFQLSKGTFQYCNCSVSVVLLDWNTITPNEFNHFQSDVLLAADTFYDPSQFDGLIQLFSSFLTSDKNRKVYIAYVERNSETSVLFSKKIGQMNLSKREMKGPQKLNFIYSENIPVRIYELSS